MKARCFFLTFVHSLFCYIHCRIVFICFVYNNNKSENSKSELKNLIFHKNLFIIQSFTKFKCRISLLSFIFLCSKAHRSSFSVITSLKYYLNTWKWIVSRNHTVPWNADFKKNRCFGVLTIVSILVVPEYRIKRFLSYFL